MLKRVSNKEVQGPAFSVDVPNIHQVRYIEGSRIAIVEIEGSLNKKDQVEWVLYKETLQGWQPPYETDEMSSNKRAEILSNINESLNLLTMPHKFI